MLAALGGGAAEFVAVVVDMTAALFVVLIGSPGMFGAEAHCWVRYMAQSQLAAEVRSLKLAWRMVRKDILGKEVV
jgi:hypothetical protein